MRAFFKKGESACFGGEMHMEPKYRRPLTAFLLILSVFICTSDIAYAAGTPTESIDKFNQLIMYWYRLALRSVIFPLCALSFASCGFRLLFSGFLSAPMELDKVKKQILYTAIALTVTSMLPTIIGWAVGIFKTNAWQPPTLSTTILREGGV